MRKGLSLIEVIIMAVLFGIIVAALVSTTMSQKAAEKQKSETAEEAWAKRFIERLTYIKDTRTDICYACLWADGNNGGPALTTIPCDSIPPELLVVVTPDSSEPEEAK